MSRRNKKLDSLIAKLAQIDIRPHLLRDSENSQMSRQRKPKPVPTAYSQVTGKDWKQKLGFIRSANEQEIATPTDVSALFEYIDKLEAHLDNTMDDATA